MSSIYAEATMIGDHHSVQLLRIPVFGGCAGTPETDTGFRDLWEDRGVSLAPIHTERLVLRALTANDTYAVFAILGHEFTVANVSFGHATIDDTKSYIGRRVRDEDKLGYSMWAVQLLCSDTLVGLCGYFATDSPSRIELGYVIHAGQWGKGYATEAAGAAVSAASASGHAVVATIRPTNKRSLAVAARIGLEHTGTMEDERGELLVWE